MARLVLAFLWIGTMVAPVMQVVAAPAQLPALYPTPGPGCFEVIANGSFEQTGVAWVPGSGPRPPEYNSTEVLEGAQAMRLGIVDLPNVSSDSYVSQDVTLPAGATSIILRFWYWPQYDAAPGPTALQYANIINLFNGQFVAQPLGVQRNDRIWLPMQYDLTAQAGQQIRLTLGVRNDGAGGRAAMYVDNVSIIVCTVTPTPSVTATTTGTPPPTPTPTVTPVPTLPTGCTTDTILNGDFEIDAFWFFGDDPVPAGYVGSTPHTGLRSMRLGIAPELGVAVQNKESFSSINQPFTISPFASTARLRWWHFYRSEEPPLASPTILQDRQEVVLLAPDNETVAILHRTRQNEVAWKEEVVDLTPYRGRPLLLYFNAYNDGNGLRTWQYLDDVVIEVCYPPTPPPTPTSPPTMTPVPTDTGTPTPTDTSTPTATNTMTPTMAAAAAQVLPGAAAPRPGEPAVEVVEPSPMPLPSPLPTSIGAELARGAQAQRPVLWFGRTPLEVLTWIGLMLGTIAIIGLLAGLIAHYRGPSRTP